ncbi:hypothetical protein Taro_048806 [Colocasia esculenta]|uniref:Ubiquitin-like protease family profile domain-containing protein n=1 Tax=Colocasia esculenta TaxID=4460 RepID=A0A843X958_COLES|nr:hypothetical protein [Colocasia esculenta]
MAWDQVHTGFESKHEGSDTCTSYPLRDFGPFVGGGSGYGVLLGTNIQGRHKEEQKQKEAEEAEKERKEEEEQKRKEAKKKRKEEEEQKWKEAEEVQKRKREEEEKKRKEAEEAEKKRKEEEEHNRKEVEEEQKRKREEEEERKEEEEEEEKKRKEVEVEKKREEEEEEKRKTEEEDASYFPILIFQMSYSWDEKKAATRDIYGMPEDYRSYKALNVNVSTSEPIFLTSQESTDTLPTGKKEWRRDYVTRDKMNTFLTYSDLMFGGTLEGYDNFLSFKNIWDLLFAGQSESVIIDCYVNTCLFLPCQENSNIFGYLGAALKGYIQSCKDNKSKQQHFDYSFKRLDRTPTESDLLFSPMHVGTNHWALLVINIKEKEFHVYDSLRNKDRRDIPQYVEELRKYMKGKHIDTENWSLCYPDPCPQQGSGDDCAIFTCKYIECLARRDTQYFPFSQDDMPTVRARFALHSSKRTSMHKNVRSVYN